MEVVSAEISMLRMGQSVAYGTRSLLPCRQESPDVDIKFFIHPIGVRYTIYKKNLLLCNSISFVARQHRCVWDT